MNIFLAETPPLFYETISNSLKMTLENKQTIITKKEEKGKCIDI